MASTWQGSNLRDRFSEKLGDTSTAFKLRVLEWMNDVQEDICGAYNWPFLRIKLKKLVPASAMEVDLALQIPGVPTVAISAGGTLTDGSYKIKVTFVIFDESGKEEKSIESEPSVASAAAVSAAGNDTITVTALDTFDGSTSVKPTTIWRRIYLSKDGGDFLLQQTIENNTATTTTVTAETTSTIEPPERSMISVLASEHPFIEGTSQRRLELTTVDRIKSYSPAGSTGTPTNYARDGRDKILLYPSPSAAFTLSYYVYKRPARIFAETTRPIHMPQEMKRVLSAGVDSMGHDYRDRQGWENKVTLYDGLKVAAVNDFKKVNGAFGSVRDVDGDYQGREVD